MTESTVKLARMTRFIQFALAMAVVFGAQLATAQISSGSVVQLDYASNFENLNGGPFTGSVISGPGAGSTFASFCLEKLETFNLNTNLFVKSVTTATTNATGVYPTTGDPLSSETAWLFTQYSNHASGFSTTTASKSNSMQNAFWYLEGEITLSKLNEDSQAKTWANEAKSAVSTGAWSGLGNVRVLNLYKDAGYSINAQDQLVMLAPVPEPETYAMLLAGLGLMGAVTRRRRSRTEVA